MPPLNHVEQLTVAARSKRRKTQQICDCDYTITVTCHHILTLPISKDAYIPYISLALPRHTDCLTQFCALTITLCSRLPPLPCPPYAGHSRFCTRQSHVAPLSFLRQPHRQLQHSAMGKISLEQAAGMIAEGTLVSYRKHPCHSPPHVPHKVDATRNM